jgi:Ca-activated chloride channel family protein
MNNQTALGRLFLIAAISFAATVVRAGETGSIAGSVYSLLSGKPIQGARVTLVENGSEAVTDSLGTFSFDNVPPGTWTLSISHPRFVAISADAAVTVNVRVGGTSRIDIPLSKTALEQDRENNYLDGAVKDRLREPISSSEEKEEGRQNIIGIPKPVLNENQSGSGHTHNGIQSPQIPSPTQGLHRDYRSVPPARGYERDDQFSLPPFDMFFRDYGTNYFVRTRDDRFSTFAVDVDDASYTLARRYLQEGNLPPREAIRLEEFVNHFDYGYNPPDHDKFRIFTELAPSPFRPDLSVMKIGIKGRETERGERKPMNLTFVIDVSGSMGYDNRLDLVKRSMEMLIQQLTDRDRVGIVAYGSRAHVVLEPTPAHQRRRIIEAVRRLYPGGSTFAEAGLRLGYQMANRQYVAGYTNRIVLCSDGVANVGRTSADAIMNDIERWARQGIVLSSFGFGMGNYNDVLLEQLAIRGDGRYAYVNNWDEARKQFIDDFLSNMELLARDVKIQVEFDPKVVEEYRLLGYENRAVPDQRFRDNRQDGGEVGMGHEVTAVYELRLRREWGNADVATVFVRWKDDDNRQVREVRRVVPLKSAWRDFDRARPEFRLAVAATKFADVLKQTEFAEADYSQLLRIVRPLVNELPGDQTRELLDLIERARNLSTYLTGWDDDSPYRYGDDNYRR